MNQSCSWRFRTSFLMTSLVLMLLSGLASAGPPAKIEWNVPKLVETLSPGSQRTFSVEFSSNQNIAGLDLALSPSLTDVAAVSPTRLTNLVAGQRYTVAVSITVPERTSDRTYGGVLQARTGNGVPARPLPVHFQISGEYDGLPSGDEVEGPYSPGTVTIEGASPDGFNVSGVGIAFALTGESFNLDPNAAKVYRAGWPLASEDFVVSDHRVETTGVVLQEGRNRVTLWAEDSHGQAIEFEAILWAGNHTLRVQTENASGHPVVGAEVRVMLGDDDDVTFTGTTDAEGILLVPNLPGRTVILEGRKGDDLFGSAAVNGSDGTVRLPLHGFNSPSVIDNNDFSQD